MTDYHFSLRIPGSARLLALTFTLTLWACADDDKKADSSVTRDSRVTTDVAADNSASTDQGADSATPDRALADAPSGDVAGDAPAGDQTLDLAPDTSKVGDGGSGCGKISVIGCCDGELLKYCTGGKLVVQDCKTSGPKCGWDKSYGVYDCSTSGGSDPGGKYPKSCSATPPDLGPLPDSGPTPDSGPSIPCGSVTYQGCCDGQTLKYCDSGKLETLDCSKDLKCGWESAGPYYDCGTAGTSDPSGKYPMICKAAPDAGPTPDGGPTPDSGPVSDGAAKDAGPIPDGAGKDVGPTPDGTTGSQTIVITEMLINSKAVGDTKGEWFELYNAGTAAVNLHGWSITDQAGSSQNKHTINATGGKLVIAAGAYLVLGKSTKTSENGTVAVDYAYGKSTWDLGNSGDEIYLFDASKKLVDKVIYTSKWTIPNGATLSLKSPALDNNDPKNWCAEKTKWCSTCDMGTPGKKAGCK